MSARLTTKQKLMRAAYGPKLAVLDQIDAEEQIAAIIFDHERVETDEETAGDLGRTILQTVLRRFRPDLFTKR